MIIIDRKKGIVSITADNGVTRDWGLQEFEVDPTGCVAQTGNGIKPPPAHEPTTEEKLAAAEAKLSSIEAFLVGKDETTALDVRTDVRAIIAALKAENILTDEKIDAQRKATYRDNGDGTISRLDKYGAEVVTFDPKDTGIEQTMYATWLSMGGKPLPPDITAIAVETAKA